jgi:trans-aconitate 2-methyltransferase
VTATSWNPGQYLRFGDERARPFHDLVDRVPVTAAGLVVDLGCGPGGLTATLPGRFGGATVVGVDHSADMMAAAAAHRVAGLRFEQGDARTWEPPGPVDVLVSNATFQWIEDHLDLLGRWLSWVRPGGWFAVGVPGNFASPSHRSIEDLVTSPRWAAVLDPDVLERPRSAEPVTYLERLVALGAEVEVWETTYHHVLAGPDPVLEWLRGTALRPVLARLDERAPQHRAAFEAELATVLRRAYPPSAIGTVFPFRRIFAVAHRR